jgi:hypothetical protein
VTTRWRVQTPSRHVAIVGALTRSGAIDAAYADTALQMSRETVLALDAADRTTRAGQAIEVDGWTVEPPRE